MISNHSISAEPEHLSVCGGLNSPTHSQPMGRFGSELVVNPLETLTEKGLSFDEYLNPGVTNDLFNHTSLYLNKKLCYKLYAKKGISQPTDPKDKPFRGLRVNLFHNSPLLGAWVDRGLIISNSVDKSTTHVKNSRESTVSLNSQPTTHLIPTLRVGLVSRVGFRICKMEGLK